jgi:hypothetical protein
VNPRCEFVDVAGEAGLGQEWQADRDRDEQADGEEAELAPAPGAGLRG